MAGTSEQPRIDQRGRTGRVPRPLKWILAGLGGLALLTLLLLAGLNSEPGRRFVAERISGLELENGLRVGVGRIEGSLYSKMTIHGFSLSDPDGVFLRAQQLRLDWRPLSYIGNHLDLRSVTAGSATLVRLPSFRETPPSDAPLLPDLDISLGELRIDRLTVEPAVTGERQVASIRARARIADRRAQVALRGEIVEGKGRAGGDRIAVTLDAVPEDNRLALAVLLDAPSGGLFARIAGLQESARIRIEGAGDWARWDGKLAADLGASPFARLALSARDGSFGIRGPTRPGLLLEGSAAAILAPVTNISLRSTWEKRVAQFDARAWSEGMEVRSEGTADLGRSRFRSVAVDARLLRPGLIADNVAGSGVRARLRIDGAMRSPDVDYQLTAGRIAFADVALLGLEARGEARFRKDHLLVPIAGRASAITGLDVAAGGAIRNVRLDGDLAIDWPRIVSDNLRIRSDRIEAGAILLANVSTGLYTGSIDGKVDNYRLESVGIFRLETDAKLASNRDGLSLTGSIRARSTRIFSDAVRDFLGGNLVAAGRFSYGPDAVIRLSNIRLNAPAVRIDEGEASYAPDGRIRGRIAGTSRDYGPVAVEISGTASRPDAVIVAERPGLGVGLANFRARLIGSGRGYDVRATGDTRYGAIDANVLVRTGDGALVIDVRSASLAGIAVTGRVRQTPSGPFAGSLAASGQGITGSVVLSAAGEYQQLIADLKARDARLPPPADIMVRMASVEARVILYDRPEIVADVQLADGRAGESRISELRALIDYRGGRGTARMIAAGRIGVPFRVAMNGAMEPDLWRIAARGKVNGIALHTLKPARIVPGDGRYELLPTVVALDEGSLHLAGTYADALSLKARLDKVNMALLDTFAPGLGVGGTASGALELTQNATGFPLAEARLAIRNFTRSTATAVSQPMDVNLVASLDPDRASLKAVLRTRGTVIGRLQAFGDPLGPGRSWTERISAASLRGGIRYMGPADTLFSFAGLADQSLEGPLGVAADFGCRLSSPCLSGVVRGRGLSYRNSSYGTRLTNMELIGRFSGERLEIEQLRADAGNGQVTGSGFISLAASRGYPANIDLRFREAELAKSDDLSVTASGELRLVKPANAEPVLTGTVRLPSTRYRFVRQGAAQVPTLSGVRFKRPRQQPRETGDPVSSPRPSFADVRLDLEIEAPNQLYVSGMGLESEWRADLAVSGTAASPRIAGTVSLIRGTLGFAGRSFTLEEGQIRFLGGSGDNATIRLSAVESIDDVAISVNVSGSVTDPRVTFSSTPALPQDEILARILFGDSIGSLSTLQAVQLAASLNSLRGSGRGLNPLGKLRSATGFDRLRILAAEEASGRGTALAIGKYIADDVYLEVVTDARGFTATQLEITLSPSLSILSRVGGTNASNLSVRYRKTY